MSPEERRARAFRVQAALEDGVLAEVFDELAVDLTREWATCFDAAERDNLWHTQRALGLLRSKLAAFAGRANEGQMAAIRRAK